MIMHSIIDSNREKLKFIGKSDENIDLSIQAITEFKKHQISQKMLEDGIGEIKDEYLKTKLQDMMLIYKSYEENHS